MESSQEETSSEEASSEEPSSEQTSGEEPSSEESSTSLTPIYDEPTDSIGSEEASDLSALYAAFEAPITNYTSTVKGYFNAAALYDYYRHYQKNYVQDNVNLFVTESAYRYPSNPAYLGVLNSGYLDYQGNAYSYALQGESVEERLATTLAEEDLTLVKESDSYRNHLFTLEDLNETYFTTYGFTRVSQNKYQYERLFDSAKDNLVFSAFIDLCAPGLINTGYYMTFSRVTIELHPSEGVAMRLRLYAYETQGAKLLPERRNKDYPNWYMLFSEAEITYMGTTEIAPVRALISK